MRVGGLVSKSLKLHLPNIAESWSLEKLYVNCIVKHIKFRGCLAISAWQRFNLFLRKQYYLARGVGKLVHILVNTIPYLAKLLPRLGLSQPTGKGGSGGTDLGLVPLVPQKYWPLPEFGLDSWWRKLKGTVIYYYFYFITRSSKKLCHIKVSNRLWKRKHCGFKYSYSLPTTLHSFP